MATINVNPGGSIQGAINGANSGDTITVAAGTYQGDVNVSKTLTLQGGGTAKIAGRLNVPASSCVVDGFSCAISGMGSGQSWCSVTGNNNVVKNIVYDGIRWTGNADEATAFFMSGSGNTFLKCRVSNCDSTDAFHPFGQNNTIDSCEVYGLTSNSYGSGAHVDCVQFWGANIQNITVQNCYFHDNQSQTGIVDVSPGGSNSSTFNFTWRNNIVRKCGQFFCFVNNARFLNSLWYDTGDQWNNILYFSGSNSGYQIKNCCFAGGSGWIDGGTPGYVSLDHNFAAKADGSPVSWNLGSNSLNGGNPKFVSPPNDFHLQTGSPLIGAAAPQNPAFPDKDGKDRGSSWDIGPYEAGAAPPPQASTKFRQGDTVETTEVANIRSTPAGQLLGTQAAGAQGTIQASPATPANFNNATVQWWQVTFAGAPSGWVGEDVLSLSASAPEPPGETWNQWTQALTEAIAAWITANPPTPDALKSMMAER